MGAHKYMKRANILERVPSAASCGGFARPPLSSRLPVEPHAGAAAAFDLALYPNVVAWMERIMRLPHHVPML